MTTLAALSLHFPFVWYGFLLLFGLALGSFYGGRRRALTLRQDSHQLSLSGQGTLSPDGRYLFRGTLQPRQGMPPLLALPVTRPTANNAPGPTPWQLQGKWLPQEQK